MVPGCCWTRLQEDFFQGVGKGWNLGFRVYGLQFRVSVLSLNAKIFYLRVLLESLFLAYMSHLHLGQG